MSVVGSQEPRSPGSLVERWALSQGGAVAGTEVSVPALINVIGNASKSMSPEAEAFANRSDNGEDYNKQGQVLSFSFSF